MRATRWDVSSSNHRFGVCWWDAWANRPCLEIVLFGRRVVLLELPKKETV